MTKLQIQRQFIFYRRGVTDRTELYRYGSGLQTHNTVVSYICYSVGRYEYLLCLVLGLVSALTLLSLLSISRAYADLPYCPDDRVPRRHIHSIPPQY
jgi:hypothetical protein